MKVEAAQSTLRLANIKQNDKNVKKSKKIFKSRLINLLNRINFRNGVINVHFKQKKYNHFITVQAQPQVCNNDFLRCLWSEHFNAEKRLKHFHFHFFTFTDGLNQIQVKAKLTEMNNNGIYLELPETCHEIQTREIKRHRCKDITAQLIQDGRVINAHLSSFSAQAFALSFLPDSPNTDPILDQNIPVNVVFTNTTDYIFSGNCDIIRHNVTANKNQLILKPVSSNIQLFKPKEVRSERLVLNPLPNILFRHPLTGKNENPNLIDISGTGFAVAEDEDNAVLMPGMIIPELKVEFIQGFSVTCRAQVVYHLHTDTHVKCGIAILDMKMEDHIRLSSYLHQAKNKHSSISTTNVDLDALWDFFFESGFIYPDKYEHISAQKEQFQRLYLKLYNECPGIARHVMYQDKGKIYGHVSMFRYYRNTWIMHHHAAIKSSKHKAGLVVMEHILQYINECHTLPSAKMKYIACYFRPKNRFANRVFGGAARSLDDPKKCSLDKFVYFHFEPESKQTALPPLWSFEKTMPDDLQILKHWYNNSSGGLLIEGLDLGPDAEIMDRETNQEYKRFGFSRTRELFSLKNDGELLGIFVVNRSDLGMNMSDLTNCIQAFVLDQNQVSKRILYRIFSRLAVHFDHKEVPVLLYPNSYANAAKIPYDKTYELTVLDLANISQYLLFMHSLTTQRNRKVKHLS